MTQTEQLADFLLNKKTTAKNKTLFLAIDPGSEGAIGMLSGQNYTVIDIPTLKIKRGKGKKTVFDLPQIVKLFDILDDTVHNHQVVAIVEQPPPSMGKGKGSAYGQFRLGCAYAMWPLFLISRGYSVTEVSPGVWKKKMKISSDKETARYKAQRLFPKAPLSRKRDHNRAEALLLAKYHAINQGV